MMTMLMNPCGEMRTGQNKNMRKRIVSLLVAFFCVLGGVLQAAVPTNAELAKMSSAALLQVMREMSTAEMQQLLKQVSGEEGEAASATVRSRVATNYGKIVQGMGAEAATEYIKATRTDALVISISARGNYSVVINVYTPDATTTNYVPRTGTTTTLSVGTQL